MKRAFDITFALLGLTVLWPAFAVLALVIKVSDGGSVFFRQERVGQGGHRFTILKFRSMIQGTRDEGLSITKEGDPRITPVGRFMRGLKLDELPQLWNVLVGEMSFVGPRPEVPVYVNKYTDQQRRILELKPGITDPATLEFRNEERMLSKAGDTERFYLNNCMPRKIELSLAYAERANLWTDLGVIVRTVIGEKRPQATDYKLPTADCRAHMPDH